MPDLDDEKLGFDDSSPVREVELGGEGVGEFLAELMDIRVQALEGRVSVEVGSDFTEYAVAFAKGLRDKAVELQGRMPEIRESCVIPEGVLVVPGMGGGQRMSDTGIVLAAGLIAASLPSRDEVLDRIRSLAAMDDIGSQVERVWYMDILVPESVEGVVEELVSKCSTWQNIHNDNITPRGRELPSFWREVNRMRGNEPEAGQGDIKQIILNRYSEGRVLVGSIPMDGSSLVMGILI